MGEWRFVGRVAELAALPSALVRSSAGALLVGAPGVGKTRLAREVLRQCQAGGRETTWVSATAATAQVPLGAVSHLLPDPAAAELQPGQLFHRATAHLSERTSTAPLLIGVDDVHHLDDTSGALLHHLTITGSATLLATTRTDEHLPEPIAALRKDGYLARQEILAFDEPTVGQALEQALAGQVAAATVHRLATATGGNAFYLRELVTSGLESGSLSAEDGVWHWRGALQAHRLTDLLDRQLDHVGREDRDALDCLAFGEPLELSVLHAVAPGADPERLERAGFVVTDLRGHEPHLRLAHPLYADVLRAKVPTLGARRIWARLADALERCEPGSDSNTLRLATWRVASGGKADPTLLTTASYQAFDAADYPLAEKLARAAADSDSSEANYVLALTLARQGKVSEAGQLLAQLEMTAGDDELADLVVTSAMQQFWFGGRRADAEGSLQRAAAIVRESTSKQATVELTSARTTFLLLTASTTETLESAHAVLDEPEAPEIEVLRSAICAAMAASVGGRTRDALDYIEIGRPLAPRHARLQAAPTDLLLTNRSLALRLRGQADEALAQAERGHEASVEAGAGDVAHPLWLMALGQANMATGSAGTAVRWLKEAAMWLRNGQSFPFLPWCLSNLSQALGLTGNAEEARRVLSEAEERYDPGFPVFEADLHLARAWTAAAGGEQSRAATCCVRAADAATALDQHAFAMLALSDAARLGRAEEVQQRLDEVASHVDGDLAPALCGHTRALAEADPEGLENAAQRFEALGYLLHSAEAWAEASRARRGQGKLAAARAATAQAKALAARCRGARTPALSGLADVPLVTRREREVAELVARGHSNREIADRLHVSVRTVENHLHHVYTKLGVSDRAGLRDLVERGLPGA